MAAKRITLALQGGGSHGAFTWGVLDRLLEDERINIEAISGASAGAMNAAVLAHGLTTGGRDGARQALKDFWSSVAGSAPFSTIPDYLLSPQGLAVQTDLPSTFKPMLSLARFFRRINSIRLISIHAKPISQNLLSPRTAGQDM